MLTLGIETATDQGAVALCHGGQLLGEVSFSARMGQAERLVPAVDALLQLHRLCPKDLELIAVAIGPGSFTGLRIGMATAKGLAQALHLPLIGVASADAVAWRAGTGADSVCVILSDRRNLVYDAFFLEAKKIGAEESRAIETLIAELRRRSQSEKVFCIGSGAEAHRAALAAMGNVTVAPAALNLPSALGIAWLGWQKYDRTRHDELWTLEPLYVQRLMAEATDPGQTQPSAPTVTI
jgi:tRNA threonylcarbamoyladenosine biosynthesis protein TsaB